MKIAYIKTKWEDKKTPVNAINLGNIENTLEKVTEGALGIDQLKADPGIVINEDTDNNEIRVGIDPGFIVTPGNLTTEINKINADIIEETERAKEAELKNHNSITFLQTQLNNIVNGDASSAIESFNEILEFLSSISDSTTLAGIVSQLNNSIQAEVTRATAAETINSQLISSLQTSVNGIISGNISIHTAISNLQAVIQNVAENGFNVIDPSGNIGLKYDENGLDAALLSTHFQGLINTLISTLITTAKGTTLAPLVDSLIPSTYLPSYVDDVVDIDIFGTTAIAQYCSDNDGNTATLTDKFCYDDENKIFQLAKQVGTSINLIDKGTPESGKIYIDINTNKSYRWSGTIMSEISNSIALGENANTAYAGDKGKLNATNIATAMVLINRLSVTLSVVTSMFQQISEDGYNMADPSGNVGMKYDSNGFDVAKLSTHIISLIKSAIGNVGGSDTHIVETEEDGFYIIDDNGYILFSIDPTNGIQFAKVGDKAKEAIGTISYTVINSSVDL